MQSYRIGNDIPFRWPIYTGRDIDRIPFDLTGRKLTLEAISKTGKSYPIEMTTDGNIVQGTFYGKDQKVIGPYVLVLIENKDEVGMRTIDTCDFVNLVDRSYKATGGSNDIIHYDVMELSGSRVATYSGVVDSELSETSANPVENRVVTKALNEIGNKTAEGLDAKLDKDAVVQESGTGTDKVMSQKVVTDIKDALEASIAKKQAKLTAGRGINISGSVISSTLDTNPFVVVSSLPATGDSEKIYLVPAEKQEEGNLTDEWIWNNGKWERLGSAKVDLTPYAKTEDVEAALEAKQDTISDLVAIRSGAAKGATALQNESDPVYLADKPYLALKSEIPDIVQETGDSVTAAMSQDAVTKEFAKEQAKLTELERDLGQYAELPSVAMTAETTGKYINADGEFVDDADFNIAAIGAVVVGNTYELYMGGAANMKLGVSLFVARIKTTTTSGTERTEYVPLFSAMSTDIPTSGYVCFEAMEAYSDVLVCYRADVPEAATLLVRRYGTKASIATQINNLRKKVDLKSFADGYYESMRVGTADNLTSKGDATEEVIMSRKAGGDNQIEDGSASIKRIKGYSVVCNQKIALKDGAKYTSTEGLTFTANKNKILITGKASKELYVSVSIIQEKAYKTTPNHRYLVLSDLSSSIGLKVYFNDEKQTQKWNDIIIAGAISGEPIFAIPKGFDGDTHEVKFYLNIIDLTQMFGSGNEPATPEDFAKRLGYSSIDDVPYIPYNEGEIVSSFAEGIKTTDTEGKVSERKWSETLKKYFPDGLKSVGAAYDEITPTKAVKRIEMVPIVNLTWESKTTVDGHNFYECSRKCTSNVIITGYNRDTGANIYYGKVTNAYGVLTEYNSLLISDANYIDDLQGFLKNAKEKGLVLQDVVATPEEYIYDELNLTEQVSEGGTEEAIITEGKTSTPLRAEIVYPIDAYNTIKANKANIGTLSSLNTASKTDLVSAINELAGKVAALEANATEVTNETTE